jgi:hypothetical protein
LVSFFTDIHVPGETTTETVPDGDNCKTTTKEAVLKTTTAATCHPKPQNPKTPKPHRKV